ncbi:MAG: hypothetical protein ABH950_04975, partial [Candidatus Altiarchaeota archaeon]
MNPAILLLIGPIIAFILTVLFTPPLIKYMHSKGIYGADAHKIDHPRVAEMGGAAILASYTIAALVPLAIFSDTSIIDSTSLIAAVGVFLGAGIVGILDDRFKLHHLLKPILLLA